jgi:diguanylate cyclase (GGDEF)-like protein
MGGCRANKEGDLLVEDRRGRVLVVEDDPVQRTYIRACLESEFDVLEAEDGASGLALLMADDGVDLVVLDVEMPGMDGYAVLGRIRRTERYKSLPVLILTSREDQVDEELGLNLGASDFQVKPPRPGALTSRLRNLIGVYREQIDLTNRLAIDPLSGLAANRRFREALSMEWRRCARRCDLLTLILLDLDHFQAYNTALGRAKGDEVVRLVGTLIRDTVGRSGDLAARVDGGDFALLLPGTDELGGRRVAEGLRAALDALALPHGSSPLGERITVSMGGSSTLPAREGGEALFLAHVDDLLKKAKATGRNRTIWQAWQTPGWALSD